jgi:hypothetical protein
VGEVRHAAKVVEHGSLTIDRHERGTAWNG